MGLRINTNVPALQALYNLQTNSQNQAHALEQLSTGFRINTGADDPAGLVISEQLKSQLSSLNQAVQNSQNAGNLISIADSGLSQIGALLTQIQGSVEFALNSGGASSAQIAAQQATVDQSVQAINRIGNTTRFGSQNLLNGNQSYIQTGTTLTKSDGTTFTPAVTGVAEVQNASFQSVVFPQGVSSRTLNVSMVTIPQRAEIRLSGTASAAGTVNIIASGITTLQITGPTGTASITLANGTFNSGIETAINGVAAQTGVYASAVNLGVGKSANLSLFSNDFGSSQTIQIQVTSGAIGIRQNTSAVAVNAVIATRQSDAKGTLKDSTQLTTASAYNSSKNQVTDTGRDGQVFFEGVTYTGQGANFSLLGTDAQISFNLNPDQITAGVVNVGGNTTASGLQSNTNYDTAATYNGITIGLAVQKSGLLFQINSQPTSTDQVAFGIPSINASTLGTTAIRDRIAEAGANLDLPIATANQINKGGFLNTLVTGGTNSLANNAQNAGNIVNAAINQVSALRGFIGAVQAEDIQPNTNAVQTEIQNLSSSLSSIRDTDFAAATTQFTKTQILFQSGIAVLASANLIPQSVLTLLR